MGIRDLVELLEGRESMERADFRGTPVFVVNQAILGFAVSADIVGFPLPAQEHLVIPDFVDYRAIADFVDSRDIPGSAD